jgi:cardiolipin synthase
VEEIIFRWINLSAFVRSDVVTLSRFALSLAVMVHVLLHRREVGATIGWIGLAWLAPITGSALYALFGVNRVSRRARQLDMKLSTRAEAAPARAAPVPSAYQAFEHAVRQITRLPIQEGNSVQRLHNGDEAYPAMLAAIDTAQNSVALSSYIFRDDEVGGTFFEALVAAKARGAEVRVLIDGIGSGYFLHRIYRRLRRAGVPVALFMHSALPWRMPFLNLRTHKKLLIVDGAIGFTGGINIADENRVASHPRRPVRDTHFRFEGPVVGQLARAFARSWAFAMGEELEGERWFPSLASAGEAMARVVTSGPDADIEKIEFVVLQAMTCARKSIRLVTPYFLPNEVVTSVMSLAAVRGITVDVIIPQASNHRLVDWATRAHVGPLLENGVHVWLDEPPFDHSKLLVIDEIWCFVGSANWDMRSFRLNFELNVEIYDEDIAEQITGTMENKMTRRLTQADLVGRSLLVRLRDAGARLLLPYI